MNNLTVFYRLSDKGNPKKRMQNLDYKKSLYNFVKEFEPNQIEIVADNVNDETLEWLQTFNFKKLHQTSLGNSASFWYIVEHALKLDKNHFIYFVEDDYLHKPKAKKVLLEGLKIADYVTLYDHPDKYMNGVNPEVKNGGENCKVFLTQSTHWKITNSTTMTFACSVNTLKKDNFFFKAFTVGVIKTNIPLIRRISYAASPRDYNLFICLRNFKKRILISPIPGYATHGETDYLAPLINWNLFI